MKILLLANSTDCAVIKLQLGAWSVSPAHDLDEAKSMLRHDDFDLVLLGHDFERRGEGLGAIGKLRRAEFKIPLIYLACYGASVADKVSALSAGADDLLVHPWNPEELRVRVIAVVRRCLRGVPESKIRIGEAELDLYGRTVTVSGELLHLTGKEYQIFEALVMRGTLLTKDQLLTHLYDGMDDPGEKIIDVFVCKIRKKFRDAGVEDIIKTVWGRGYQIEVAAA